MKNSILLFLTISIFACQNSELNQIKDKISIRGTVENGEVITAQDISEIKYLSPGTYSLKFTSSGKEKMRLITTANLNKNIEIRLGNEVVSKPVVREIIDGDIMQITGIKALN